MATKFPDPDAYGSIKPRPAIVTLSWSEDKPGGYGTQYAHLECAAMRLDPDGTPRNGGHRDALEGLTATAQWSREDMAQSGASQPYAWQVAYHDAYRITFEDAERMLDTLKVVRRSFERIALDAGQPTDFGTFALRFARAIGATAAMFRPTSSQRAAWLSDGEWITLDVADIPGWFARRTAEYRESATA
jgi:hypothetical protein